MRTSRQQTGDAAESLVAESLAARGWGIVARNVHVGRAEIDLVAVDPGPPAELVILEVRWRGRRDYGLPEETVDRRKRLRLRAAGLVLVEGRVLPDGNVLPRLPLRFDLVAVEPPAGPGGRPRIRHHRRAL